MSKMVLADATEIKIEEGSALSDIRVVSESMEAMVETWKTLTVDNIADVQILNDDGVAVGQYTNLVLVSETSVIQADGSIATSFNLREKTVTELLQEKIAVLESDMAALNTALGGE